MGQSEEVALLVQAKAQFEKAFTEVNDKIAVLTAAVEDQDNASPELVQAANDLKALAQRFDDIVTDVVTPPVDGGTDPSQPSNG